MKNAAMIIVSAIMGFLILGIVLTIGGSMNRRCEVETILPSAMEKTVEGMPFAEAGGSSGELVIAECVELLAAEIDTDSDVVLKVYQNDVQKGVLSMKLRKSFNIPMEWKVWQKRSEQSFGSRERICQKISTGCGFTGTGRECSGRGAVIRHIPWRRDNVCSRRQNREAMVWYLPGWHDWNDYAADFSQPIEENRDYYAAWE